MSFLSTLGKVFRGIALGGQIATEIAPAVPGNAGTILTGIGGIGSIVGVVEGALEKGSTGAQKLALAAPIVEQAVLAELSARGLKVADSAKFKTAINELTSATVDLYNALETPAATTAPVAPVAPPHA